MNSTLKRVAAKFPLRVQQELKRGFFAFQIRHKRFYTSEKEYALLDRLVAPGDWVLDIGANIGHYTKRLSDLVGHNGRVIAFEPVPDTFELLAANTQRFQERNVTLFNAAVSKDCATVGMQIPAFSTGLSNYYEAHLTKPNGGLNVLAISVDTLRLPHMIKLAKIDAEGHELAVLYGMADLIKRDHPILIVETFSREVEDYLQQCGYRMQHIDGSSNKIFSTTIFEIR